MESCIHGQRSLTVLRRSPTFRDGNEQRQIYGLIDVHGDVAFSESYVIAAHRYVRENGQGADFLCGARYVDRFNGSGGQWRIAHRQLLWDWARDNALAGVFGGVGIDPNRLQFGEHGRTDGSYRRAADAV